jgi:hypothetical protein
LSWVGSSSLETAAVKFSKEEILERGNSRKRKFSKEEILERGNSRKRYYRKVKPTRVKSTKVKTGGEINQPNTPRATSLETAQQAPLDERGPGVGIPYKESHTGSTRAN